MKKFLKRLAQSSGSFWVFVVLALGNLCLLFVPPVYSVATILNLLAFAFCYWWVLEIWELDRERIEKCGQVKESE